MNTAPVTSVLMRQCTLPAWALPGVCDSFALENNLGHVPNQGHLYHSWATGTNTTFSTNSHSSLLTLSYKAQQNQNTKSEEMQGTTFIKLLHATDTWKGQSNNENGTMSVTT